MTFLSQVTEDTQTLWVDCWSKGQVTPGCLEQADENQSSGLVFEKYVSTSRRWHTVAHKDSSPSQLEHVTEFPQWLPLFVWGPRKSSRRKEGRPITESPWHKLMYREMLSTSFPGGPLRLAPRIHASILGALESIFCD